MDDGPVANELTKYLPVPESWRPIIEKDIDGPSSIPLKIDNEVPSLGKYSASRRVTRTIFLGSAPTAGTSNRGLDSRRVLLGCALPGESLGFFTDALRRLVNSATYLYEDNGRFWFDTQPTIAKLVEDRAELLRTQPDVVAQELRRRMRELTRNSEEFGGIHLFPTTASDVPDEIQTRLVILGIEAPYLNSQSGKSEAEHLASQILESRGTAPRKYKNTLVFLAADQNRVAELESHVRRYLAWESVLDSREELDLSPTQVRQGESQKKAANDTVQSQIPETYRYILYPYQPKPTDSLMWSNFRFTTNQGIVLSVLRKLKSEDQFVTALGGTNLRRILDEIPLWRGDNVQIKQLVEDFASYTYLPRLANPQVLYSSINSGLSQLLWYQDTYAFAERYDETSQRYLGLVTGEGTNLQDGSSGLLVKATVAYEQRESDNARENQTISEPVAAGNLAHDFKSADRPLNFSVESTVPQQKPTRYFASAELDTLRPTSAVSQINEEIISHLIASTANGGSLTITIEIEAKSAEGFSPQVVRIVSENGRSLRLTKQGFEE